jgi:hypothetical protein
MHANAPRERRGLCLSRRDEQSLGKAMAATYRAIVHGHCPPIFVKLGKSPKPFIIGKGEPLCFEALTFGAALSFGFLHART